MRRTIVAVGMVGCLAAAPCIWYAAHEWSADRDEVMTSGESIVPAVLPPLAAPPSLQAVASSLPAETTGGKSAEPPQLPRETPEQAWGAHAAPISTAASFVYSKNHPATPLPALAFAAMTSGEPMNADEFGPTLMLPENRIDAGPGQLRMLSRDGLCSAIVAVAKANDLPIPFFANLIWQESSFRLKTISRAGALGVAQFIPETAVEHGLMNPFEPVHALFASGKLLRKLNQQFGNLGLAAAAYNAGPQRVHDWLSARRGLPAETRAYVIRITGHRAERWLASEFRRGPEAVLMPARAPCAEVTAEVKAQTQFVNIARLMLNLVAATAPPQGQPHIAVLPPDRPKLAQGKSAKPKRMAAQAPPSKPAARVRVADTSMKDQSRLSAGRRPAMQAKTAASTDVRHAAAQ